MQHFDLAVIGGGSAGLTAAIIAARVGAKVVIAMKAGLTLDDLGSVIHVYPTMNRIIRRLADEQFLEHGVGRWTARLFGRFKGRGDS